MGRKTLLIGIGESGCNIAQACAKRMRKEDKTFVCFAMDTDLQNLATKTDVHTIPISDNRRMEEHILAVSESGIGEWLALYPDSYASEYVKSLEMHRGANLWRVKGALSFLSYLTNGENREKLKADLDAFCNGTDSETEINVFIASSLCGGTGSGAFILVSLFVKQYLENKTGKKIDVNAFLLCPNIYDTQLSQEQMIKANANAYAALREVNAMNTVCFGNAVQENCFTVKLKLGSKKDNALGVLFDSEDEAFQCEEAAPFQKIYLFEKQMGGHTIASYEEMVSNVICLMSCQDFLNRTERNYGVTPAKEAIFRSVSLTKVHYPKDSIAKYIVKQSVYDSMRSWQDVHSVVMERVKQYRAENFHARKTDTCELYPSIFLATVSEKYDAEGKAELKEREKLGAAFYEMVDNALPISNLEEIKETLQSARQLMGEKMPKKELRDSIAKLKLQALDQLSECLDSGMELLKNCDEFIGEHLRADHLPGTILDGILRVDGQATTPIVGLMRLIQAKELLESYGQKKDSFTPAFVEVTGAPTLDEDRLQWEIDQIIDSKNSAISMQAKGLAKKKYKGKFKDWLKFEEKFSLVYQWWMETLKATIYARIAKKVKEYIVGSINVFAHSENFLQSLQLDTHLALVENCETSELHANVYVSEEDKACAYASYLEQKGAHATFENECLETLSAIFDELSLGDLEESQLAASVTKSIEKLLSDLTESFKETAFYKNHLNKDLLDVITAPSPVVAADASANSRNVTLRKLLKAGKPSLKVAVIDDERERLAMRTERTVVFSKYPGRESEQMEKINAMLLDAGEHDSTVKFAETCAEDSMFIYKELKNVRLAKVTFMDEAAGDMQGYKSCEKSLQMMQKQFSQLWNPYLTNKGQAGLPFINEDIEKENKKKIPKALLYAIVKEKLYLSKTESGKQVYFTDRNEEQYPLVLDEEYIKKGQYHKLIEWLSQNTEQTKWRDAYNYHVGKELADFALNGAALDGADKLFALSKTLPLFGGILQQVFHLAYVLKNDFGFSFYARQLLLLGDELITQYSKRWEYKSEEISDQLKRMFIEELKTEFIKAAKPTGEELTAFEAFIAETGCYTYRTGAGENRVLQFSK